MTARVGDKNASKQRFAWRGLDPGI